MKKIFILLLGLALSLNADKVLTDDEQKQVDALQQEIEAIARHQEEIDFIKGLKTKQEILQKRIDRTQLIKNDTTSSSAVRAVAQKELVRLQAELAALQPDANAVTARAEQADTMQDNTGTQPKTSPSIPTIEQMTQPTMSKQDLRQLDADRKELIESIDTLKATSTNDIRSNPKAWEHALTTLSNELNKTIQNMDIGAIQQAVGDQTDMVTAEPYMKEVIAEKALFTHIQKDLNSMLNNHTQALNFIENYKQLQGEFAQLDAEFKTKGFFSQLIDRIKTFFGSKDNTYAQKEDRAGQMKDTHAAIIEHTNNISSGEGIGNVAEGFKAHIYSLHPL